MTNLRDLGGLPVVDGRAVRAGTVHRSEAPRAMVPEVLERLRAFGFATVIDLRTGAERDHDAADLWGSGILPRMRTVAGADRLTSAAAAGLGELVLESAAGARALMLELYAGFPEVLVPAVGQVADAVLADRAPVLVHCAAGKDRTGFTVAALLLAVGVRRDAVVAEYLRSNEHFDAPRIAELLEEAGGGRVEPAVAEPLRCAPDYLEASFAAMRAEAGSVEGHLERHAGLTPARREALRDALLA